MATVPLSATNIRLLTGVPFTNDYKHTRWFDSLSQQTSYFQSKNSVYTKNNHSFLKIENSHVVSVNEHIDNLWGANYMMFQNEHYNDKWFYAFVTKLEYVNVKVTKVYFTLDVFQTWCFDMNFKPSYVVREHRPLWNSDGTPVINTIDEGLNYGSEYETIYSYKYTPNGGFKWLVIVSKTPLENDDNKVEANVIGTPQPLCYYIVPFKDDDTTPNVTLNGQLELVTKPSNILNAIYKDENAVNNVVSIYVTDYTGIPTSYSAGSSAGNTPVIGFYDPDSEVELVSLTSDTSNYALIRVKNVKRFKPMEEEILDNKYKMYQTVKESKLLMYPYCLTIVDDFKGNRIMLRNEYIESKDLSLVLKGSLGTSQKTSVHVPEYNHSIALQNRLEISDETALINNNPNDVPIITEFLASYLQGNRNSLINQKDSIIFNGVMNTISSTIGGISTNAFSGLAMAGTSAVSGAGNTVLQLQGMQAKINDINNIPPSITKMGSNTVYEVGNGYSGVFVIQKQIKQEYRKKLSDFFNMYGYKVNEVKVPNFHTRRYWNYVQTASCVITGNFNTEDLNELKSIFDNGITLWHTDDIGNYALENEVI